MLWCGNELCRFTDWLTLFLGSWYKEEINSCLYTSFIITGWKLIVLYIIYLSSPLCFPSQIIKDFPSQSILVFLYGFSHLSSMLFFIAIWGAHISHVTWVWLTWQTGAALQTLTAIFAITLKKEHREVTSSYFLLHENLPGQNSQ